MTETTIKTRTEITKLMTVRTKMIVMTEITRRIIETTETGTENAQMSKIMPQMTEMCKIITENILKWLKCPRIFKNRSKFCQKIFIFRFAFLDTEMTEIIEIMTEIAETTEKIKMTKNWLKWLM